MKRKKRHLRPEVQYLLIALIVLAAIGLVGRMGNSSEEPAAASTIDPVYTNAYLPQGVYTLENGFLAYADGSYSSETGIDVSYVQKEVDWSAVASAGISFAYIRAGYRGYSEGLLHEDDYYRQNIAGAQAAGLKIGVYWVSHGITEEEINEETAFLLDLLQGVELDLPVAFDMEVSDASDRILALSRTEKTEMALTFVRNMEAAGFDTIIYGSENWLRNEVDMVNLQDDASFWLASYDVSFPSFPYVYSIWQYSCEGIVDGIEGEVDLDLRFVKN